MTPVTIACAMAVVSWWLLSPPRSAHDVADAITVCFAAALTLGASAILIRWLWRAWRRFGHDA